MTRLTLTSLALASAALLSACGGSDDNSGTATATAPSTTSTVAMSGVASKGLMANATVTVHAVKSDGSVDATPLQTTTTDSSGHYTLTFTGTKDQPYVVRVAAKSDGSTTHLDEVTGQPQALPAGFVMRALFVPTESGNVTTSATVTPFSEMAVSAAAAASGGLTLANAAQAVSTVTQLLGFDPTKADLAAADSDVNKQKLKVLLAAVSQMASTNALGCSTGTPGEKTQCVVEHLASAAHTDSLQLTNGSGENSDVSSALRGALTTVLADDTLRGSADNSLFAVLQENLACTSACTPSTSTTGTAAAIASAKTLFTQLKSDWMALFTRTDAATLGGANVQANAFVAALQDIHVPAETMVKDTGALILGETLYRKYHAGLTTSTRMGRGSEELIERGTGSPDAPTYKAIGCTLYQDQNTTTEATSTANANYVGCRASYYYVTNADVVTDWRHGFTMTPVNNGASFTYTSRARTGSTQLQPGTSPFAGTYTPQLSNGDLVGFTLNGEVPGAFVSAANTLANFKNVLALSGQVDPTSGNISLTGSVTAYSDVSTSEGVLSIDTGTLALNQLPGGDVTPSSADLAISWTTAGAKVEGSFGFDTPVTDADGVSTLPEHAHLSGTLSTVSSGVATPFIRGTVTTLVQGYAAYHDLQDASGANSYNTTVTFVGEVSAPNRPKLQLTLAGTTNSFSDFAGMNTLSFQYRAFPAGSDSANLTLAGTVTRGLGGANFELLETASNVKVSWLSGTQQVKVKYGDTVIGVLDPHTKLLTFSDGSFQSVDLGL